MNYCKALGQAIDAMNANMVAEGRTKSSLDDYRIYVETLEHLTGEPRDSHQAAMLA